MILGHATARWLVGQQSPNALALGYVSRSGAIHRCQQRSRGFDGRRIARPFGSEMLDEALLLLDALLESRKVALIVGKYLTEPLGVDWDFRHVGWRKGY